MQSLDFIGSINDVLVQAGTDKSAGMQERRSELSKGLVSRAKALEANLESKREPERARESLREPERA